MTQILGLFYRKLLTTHPIDYLGLIMVGLASGVLLVALIGFLEPTGMTPQFSTQEVFHSLGIGLFIWGFTVVLVALWRHNPDDVFYYSVFFALRLLVSSLLTYYFIFDDELGQWINLMRGNHDQLPLIWGLGYLEIIHQFSLLFGDNLLVIKLLNISLGSLLPFLISDLTYQCYQSQSAARVSFLMAGLLPPFILYSGVHLKEIPTSFLIALAAWFLLTRREFATRWVGGFACLLALAYIRGIYWTVPIVLIASVLFVISTLKLENHYRSSRLARWGVFLVAVLILSLGLSLAGNYLLNLLRHRTLGSSHYALEFMQSTAAYKSLIGHLNPYSPASLFVQMGRALFSPSPFRFLIDFNRSALIESLTSITWYIIFPLSIIGISTHGRPRREVWGIIAACVATFIMASLEVFGGDWGRHRIVLIALLIVLAAGGTSKIRSSRALLITMAWSLSAIFFQGVWLLARLR